MKEAFFLSVFEIYAVVPWASVVICQQAFSQKSSWARPQVGLGEPWIVVRLRKHDGTQAGRVSSRCRNSWGSEGRARDTREDPQEGTPCQDQQRVFTGTYSRQGLSPSFVLSEPTTASEVSTVHCADVETEAGQLWAIVRVSSLFCAVSYRAGQGTVGEGRGWHSPPFR